MRASTVLQLIEVAVAAAILLFGALDHSAPFALLGGGFLMGLAIAAILAPEGGTIYRRSFVGYVIGGLFVLGGFILNHLRP